MRLLPGEGAVDIAEVLDTLVDTGRVAGRRHGGVLGVLCELGPAENARRQYRAATDCLVESRLLN